MSWRAALVLVLLVAALVTAWSAWRQRATPLVESDGPARSDYVLHDFELTALGDEGTESFTLRAPLLEQHPQDRTIRIDTPLFLLPDGDGDYWEVRSRTALVTADHDELHLREDVRAEGTNNAGQPVTMQTERLDIYPDTRVAQSDERVTIEQPGSTIQGRGMEVDLASKRYEFHSEVKSRYVPSRR
ncbi:MAG: LPS export ABC transporter periplasmic protein LptC [Gammaproteobacteria bacterium]|uniref:LPS export ABC transporter periplasmic protein LptC n=1 Tax=Luteimonas sp. JM171 TaxID=1896164 RepID=UPI0008588AF3|nr:LPS export ABC transporter periplasmic protein LptC [Luteimonas sp. JM171]AOH36289.1 LPS export ABC transporter periplasmic protein LptC [Luteimonas sp. JM171]NLC60035.1 LPS export ABC transporter periplasmic protein LptC [Gammaproteobacteria bacterium]